MSIDVHPLTARAASPIRRRFAAFAVCASSFVAPAAAGDAGYPPPPFFPPAGHPRVYFTARDLPRLRANVRKAQNAKAWETHRLNVERGTDGILPPPDASGRSVSSPVLAIIESLAFDYALLGREANGRKAVVAMRNYLRTAVYPGTDYNNAGQTAFTVGVVYDWCYPLLSAADKESLYAGALETARHLEVGWPPVKTGNILGHGPEGQLLRDIMSFAIAMYDEHPELYHVAAGRFFSRMVESKRFLYPAHAHNQGCHYANYRGQWEMLCTWLFDRMGLPQVFGPDQRHFMYWTIYARRGDGQILRDGDQHMDSERPGRYFDAPARPLFLAANYFKDPYLKMEALRCLPLLSPTPPNRNQAITSTEILVFNDPDLEPRPLAELPLSHYYPSPRGGMIARTGWQDGLASASVVAEFKIGEWNWANHQHLDAGAFQIYYRGALANDSGYYQAGIDRVDSAANDGSSGYGSLSDVNYNKRSVAHNVVTVYDPGERFESVRWKTFPMANDGGQRLPNFWIEAKEHEQFIDPANGYRVAEVLGHGFGPDPMSPDYTYLKGDLARAYSAKIEAYERSFVFLNLKQAAHPAALVVFDRVVSSSKTFCKAWLLHGLEEPSIVGNQTVFRDTRPGYTGKLTVDTLVPSIENATITPVGGPGKEFYVDGTNYTVALSPYVINESGGWRIEVSPRAHSETDYFLNVLQVGDHTPDGAPLTVQKIETDSHLGLRIADRVVLLARARDRGRAPVLFRFSGEGECQVLVSGLESGTWSIRSNGESLGRVTVTDRDGLAFFRARAGAIELQHD